MAHHKRRRPKHQRAGCLMCKPHKDERVNGDGIGAKLGSRGVNKKLDLEDEEIDNWDWFYEN